MKATFTPTNGIIRVFAADDAIYGSKWKVSLGATLYDHAKVCYLEGLSGGVNKAVKDAIFRELGEMGVRFVRWSHTNNRGHEVHVCCDLENGGRLKLE